MDGESSSQRIVSESEARKIRRQDVIIEILVDISRRSISKINIVDVFVDYVFSDLFRYGKKKWYIISNMFIEKPMLSKDEAFDYGRLRSLMRFF